MSKALKTSEEYLVVEKKRAKSHTWFMKNYKFKNIFWKEVKEQVKIFQLIFKAN